MPVTALTPVQLQRWLTRRWGKAAPATWNARLAASRVLVGYCQRQGWLERDPTRSLERRRTPRDETRAIPLEALDALWSRADIGLREKALWRMLYATAARASDDPVQAGAQSPPILWVPRAGFSSPRRSSGNSGRIGYHYKRKQTVRRTAAMKAKDVMSKPVLATTPRASARDIATQMVVNRLSGMPVAELDGKVISVISETDVLKACT